MGTTRSLVKRNTDREREGVGGGGDERTVCLWFVHSQITINFLATDVK